MSFTHIVTFRWREKSFAAQPIEDALNALVGTLDGVQSYLCGSDIGLTPSSYDFAVVGTFDNREFFERYRDRPEHQRILEEMIVPNLETRTVVQLER